MRIKNRDVDAMIQALKPFLDNRDMIGYAAARNTRRLEDSAVEYVKFRNAMVEKHGTMEVDENGNATGKISINPWDESFEDFVKELEPYAEQEHEVEIFKIPVSEAIGTLSGHEILALDWMLEEGPAHGDPA